VETEVISRHWRGLVRPDQARAYEKHLLEQTLPELKEIPGFVDVALHRRRVEDGVEFLVVTRWESMEAISRFAGSDTEAAVVPDEVDAMMVEYDRRVKHFEVVEK
jgi:heme-degrading monooxygenase HmoA